MKLKRSTIGYQGGGGMDERIMCSNFLTEKKINMQDIGPAPNNFLQDLLKLCRTGIYKILKFKRNR
jgi:hypothetical protein